jgi:hypothetical protein
MTLAIYILRRPPTEELPDGDFVGLAQARDLDELRMRIDEIEDIDDLQYAKVPQRASFAWLWGANPLESDDLSDAFEKAKWKSVIADEAEGVGYLVRTYAKGPVPADRIQGLAQEMGMIGGEED